MEPADEVIVVGSVTAEGLAAEDSAGGEALELMAPGDLWFNVQDETEIKYGDEFKQGSVVHKVRPVLKASEY